MEHVVFYPSADGSPAFRRVPTLEDAVKFVENLRNSEGVTEFSVHALAEVPLSLRAYYRVEIPGVDPDPEVNHSSAVTALEPSAVDAAAGPVLPQQVNTPFATAPPVDVQSPAAAAEVDGPAAETAEELGDSAEVVPAGRRSMGFFAR